MPIANLDYPGAKLAMEVNNQVEEAYRIKAASKEKWTVDFIEAIPQGAIFWDIGANTGPYSLIAAHRNLTVISIEPGFNNYAALCRNLAMNNLLDRCLTLCCALGETSRFDWLHYQDMRQGAASHILGGVRKQFHHKQYVQVWAWDELASRIGLPEERPHFAKIDIDGGEIDALKGASQMLAKLQGLMIEMRNEDEADITALMKQAGWKLTERFDQRDGKAIGNVAYGRFERT